MATISDVAKLAGVSKTTVSRVLNSSAIVNSETRTKIMTVIEQLSYVPNLNARGMRNKITGIFGVVFPEYMNPFGYELIQHIELAAARVNCNSVITSVGTGESRIGRIRELVNRGVDGLVINLYGIEPELGDYLYELSLKKPVVFLDNYTFKGPVNKVMVRASEGMNILVKHLLESGRRKIGIIACSDSYVCNDRLFGYQTALNEAGIMPRDDYIFNGDYSLQSGFDAGKYFAGMGVEKPDAIVSYTDYMAIGAMNYLQRNNILVPGDIAVAGYDGISMGKLALPALTTYAQDFERIGKEIVKILLRQRHKPSSSPREVLLNGKLIVRDSA
ncbi:MAG: LacI family transcriptional regulator [Oscillospiraceae bacterium]|nr:LacI family transcriptional regulator [Oscillospiraceae bacterium]